MAFLLCAAAGCGACGDDGSIAVTVEIDPAARTQCVRVLAWSQPGREQATAPIPREGRDSLSVALFPGGELGDTVSVVARGYEDPGCAVLNEQSDPQNERFVAGQRRRLTFHLRGPACLFLDAGSPCPGGVCRSDGTCVDGGTEFSCVNAADDDLDGLQDCLDPDCLNVGCNSTSLCQPQTFCQRDGGCSGPPLACDMPPTACFQSSGSCDPGSGTCRYPGNAGGACDDSNLCTDPDGCLEDGGCGGAPVSCATPPGQCFADSGTCDPAQGCRYPARAGTCEDNNACTTQDLCQPDAGCDGTPVICDMPPAGQCFAATGTCDPALGCQYGARTGTCDDGNPCTAGDSCLPDAGCEGMPRCASGDQCVTGTCESDGGCGFSFAWGGPCDAGLNCSPRGLCTGFPYDPSNFDPLDIPPSSIVPSILIDCVVRADTQDGGPPQWCGRPAPPMVMLSQDAGPEVAVYATYNLDIAANGELELVGPRPAILAVFGNAAIDGGISVRSMRNGVTGAGANPGSTYCATAGSAGADTYSGGGGGGGGFGTSGGNGGNATGGGSAGAAGGGASGTPELVPLRGGCGGGRGGQAVGTPGAGSPGGGAFQLSVARQLTVSGIISASGAGGDGGQEDQGGGTGGGNGGGGGGSGGAVLLEGHQVAVTPSAQLTANGGGGGEGGSWDTGDAFTGYPGIDGSNVNGLCARGGNGPSCGGWGGDGGAVTGVAQDGRDSSNGCGAGGGGGAAGRIRVNGFAQCAVDAGLLSPLPTYGGQCP